MLGRIADRSSTGRARLPGAMAGAGVAELEHFCGYGGKHLGTVHYHPQQVDTLIFAAAAAIIIEDVNDPHKQEFLRGHDAEVTALDVSANGKLVASGQAGSPIRKGAPSPVLIWNFDARELFRDFFGLAHSVLCVRFSPDGRFVVATGANQMIYVWDVSTGEAVFSRRTESPCFLGVWGPMIQGGRYPSYILCTTYDSQVLLHQLSFDVGSMGYQLSSEVVQFPSTGFQRKHICGVVADEFLITGTSAGDLCVISLRAKVFRAALPVCTNGVTGIAKCGDCLIAAGGDGRVKALQGNDTQWDVLAENCLEAGIMALAPSADGQELVCGTRNGKLWRLLSSDLTAALQSASHTGEVTDIAFGPDSDVICTASDTGEIFITDLSDYMPIATVQHTSPVRGVAMSSSGRGEILAAYDDGYVRCWAASRGECAPIWQVQAHRGGVTVVKESQNFFVTGGSDCAVKFWHRTTMELLTTFHNHAKPVSDLIIDNEKPHQVHSGSEDRSVVTYDLKMNKTLIQHSTSSSYVTGVSQRKEHEQEVVTCSLDGKIMFWDVDYPDPVGYMESPEQASQRLRCCEVSPSGRYIAVGTDDGRLYIYDLVQQGCIQECEGHSSGVSRVRWSPDQKQVVSAGKDGCVIIWNFFEL